VINLGVMLFEDCPPHVKLRRVLDALSMSESALEKYLGRKGAAKILSGTMCPDRETRYMIQYLSYRANLGGIMASEWISLRPAEKPPKKNLAPTKGKKA
jgi:hypothetical protein